MKLYIITDLEGPAGINRFDQTRDADPATNATSMELLTREVNACVDGILDADADAGVVVWDGHGSGGIDVLLFHPKAKLIARGPISAPYYLDETYDALFFVGQHAMAGTPEAPLCHTYSSKTVDWYKINGVPLGEFGCRAVMAGMMAIPTCFIAGDDKAVTEAQELVPGIVGAVVKWGLAQELALHLSPVAARGLIREKAAEAIGKISEIEPVRMDPPYEFEARVHEGVDIGAYLRMGGQALDARTVVIRTDNICDLPV